MLNERFWLQSIDSMPLTPLKLSLSRVFFPFFSHPRKKHNLSSSLLYFSFFFSPVTYRLDSFYQNFFSLFALSSPPTNFFSLFIDFHFSNQFLALNFPIQNVPNVSSKTIFFVPSNRVINLVYFCSLFQLKKHHFLILNKTFKIFKFFPSLLSIKK